MLQEEGVGCIVFPPLAQGVVTNKYLNGIPADSRAGKPHGYLDREDITEEALGRIRWLNAIAERRGQTLAQMTVSWVLRHKGIAASLFGAGKVSQIDDIVAVLGWLDFKGEELAEIDTALA